MSDLQHLFELDPLSLTRDDIDEMIAAFRAQRAAFDLGEKTPKKAKKSPKAPEIELDIEDFLKETPK